MLKKLLFPYRAGRKAVNLIAMLLVSVYTLFAPAIAHADLIFIFSTEGEVHVMENGWPSDKVDSVKLECQYYPYTNLEEELMPKTSMSIWPCQRGECPFDLELATADGSASCHWVIHTPDGVTISYPWMPEAMVFEDVYIDIATGAITVNPTPPATSTSDPIATSYKGLPVLPRISTFLAALILTWLIEVPAIFLMVRYVFRPGYGDTKRLLGVGLLATLLTLPVAWYALPFIRLVITLTPWGYIALVETLVVAVEAWIFARLLSIPVWKAVLVSLLANGLSFLVGLAVL
jgi:hypothetical protein